MTIQEEMQEYIAKLDYLWRFSGLAESDTLDAEWEAEPSQCIKQNCREFALEILKYLDENGVAVRVCEGGETAWAKTPYELRKWERLVE